MISDSVELWDTDVCFLHIQLMEANVRLPKKPKNHSEVDFESSRSPEKSEPWNKPNLQCWSVLPTWQYCRNSFVGWLYKIKRGKRLSHAWVHSATALASLLTDHTMLGLPILAKYKHLNSICEHAFDNSPTDSSASFLNWWSSKQRLETLYNCSVFASSQSLNEFLSMSFHVVGPRHSFCVRFFTPWIFSVAPAESRDPNISLYWQTTFSFGLRSRWVHPKYTWSRNAVGSPRSTSSSISSTWESYSVSFQQFWCHPRVPERISPCFRRTNRNSQFVPFSHSSYNRTSSNCVSHNTPASGCPDTFRSRGTTGCSMFAHDFGHLCRGRRIHISGHPDFGILSNLGTSSIFPECMLIRRRLLVRRNETVSQWRPSLLQPSFAKQTILVRYILRMHLTRLLQRRLSHGNPGDGWPYNFVQEVPQDVQCLPMILAICVVEDVSIYLDILTLEFWSNLRTSSIFTWV